MAGHQSGSFLPYNLILLSLRDKDISTAVKISGSIRIVVSHLKAKQNSTESQELHSFSNFSDLKYGSKKLHILFFVLLCAYSHLLYKFGFRKLESRLTEKIIIYNQPVVSSSCFSPLLITWGSKHQL